MDWKSRLGTPSTIDVERSRSHDSPVIRTLEVMRTRLKVLIREKLGGV